MCFNRKTQAYRADFTKNTASKVAQKLNYGRKK